MGHEIGPLRSEVGPLMSEKGPLRPAMGPFGSMMGLCRAGTRLVTDCAIDSSYLHSVRSPSRSW